MAVVSCAAPSPRPSEPARAPARDFEHFTFAVLWQPGVCFSRDPLSTSDCTRKSNAGSARDREWTLHGLWASLPESLEREGLTPPVWWKYGCYWYRPAHAIPKSFCDNPALGLAPPLRRQLRAAMPATRICLDRHEYFKHAQCFGFERNEFFERVLGLLERLNSTRFTAYVRRHRGQFVKASDLKRAFQRSFSLKSSGALELRCGKDPKTGLSDVLTQAWITLKRGQARSFPKARAFMDGRRGNCRDRIWVAGPQPSARPPTPPAS